jgi:hypothetical protein
MSLPKTFAGCFPPFPNAVEDLGCEGALTIFVPESHGKPCHGLAETAGTQKREFKQQTKCTQSYGKKLLHGYRKEKKAAFQRPYMYLVEIWV